MTEFNYVPMDLAREEMMRISQFVTSFGYPEIRKSELRIDIAEYDVKGKV